MDISRKYTVRDVEGMESHAELIAGNLTIEDKTSVTHNMVITDIVTALRNYFAKENANCKVFSENVALYCNEISGGGEDNYFLPDVMAVCGQDGVREDGVHVAPLFVVEVTSDATKKNDYGDKMIVYRNIGVKEYWVVDLQRKMLVKHQSINQYIPEPYVYPDIAKVSVYPGLYIDLSNYLKNEGVF